MRYLLWDWFYDDSIKVSRDEIRYLWLYLFCSNWYFFFRLTIRVGRANQLSPVQQMAYHVKFGFKKFLPSYEAIVNGLNKYILLLSRIISHHFTVHRALLYEKGWVVSYYRLIEPSSLFSDNICSHSDCYPAMLLSL